MTTFTWDQLRAEAEREVAMRKNVYWRMILPGEEMPPSLKRRIELMEAIAAHFRELAKKDLLL